MAATVLVPITISRAGVAYATPSAAVDSANGNSFANSGNQFFEIKGATASCTLTFAFPNTVDGQAVTKPITIASTDDKFFGPFPVSIYGSTVQMSWSNANPKIQLYQFVPNQ